MAKIIEFDVEVDGGIEAAMKAEQARLGNETGPKITSADGADFTMQSLGKLREIVKMVMAERTRICAPILAAKDEAYNGFKPFLTWAETAEKALRGALEAWSKAERERIDRERRAAETAAQKERDRLAAQAKKAAEQGKPEKAMAAVQKAAAVQAAPVAPQVKVSGFAVVKKKEVKVVDPAATVAAAVGNPGLLGCIEFNQAKLLKYAELANWSVPGVEVTEVESSRVRAPR